MKTDIHPAYREITATCSCGNVIKVGSTLDEDLHLDVCSACHPFYTGKQKILDSGGRIDRFRQRFGGKTAADAQEEAQKEEAEKEAEKEEKAAE